ERNLDTVLTVAATADPAQWAERKNTRQFALSLGEGKNQVEGSIAPDFTLVNPNMDKVANRIQIAVDRALGPGMISVSFAGTEFRFVSTTGQKIAIEDKFGSKRSIFAAATAAGAHFNRDGGDPVTKRPEALLNTVADLTVLPGLADDPTKWDALKADRSFSLTFQGVTAKVTPNFDGVMSMDDVANRLQTALQHLP